MIQSKLSAIGYDLWIRIGLKSKWLRTYNLERETALANAKRALEEAFDPQLRDMISKGIICDECGRYSE